MISKSICAPNMKKSKADLDQKSRQPSEEVVVVPSVIQKGTESSDSSEKDVVIFLVAVIQSLQGSVWSSDTWWFAYRHAIRASQENGASQKTIEEITRKLEKLRMGEVDRNPISGMFNSGSLLEDK